MKVKITKKYLDTVIQLEVEGQKLTDTLLQATIFTSKDKCGLCGNEQITLAGNKTDEGYIYIKRQCTSPKCRAASTLGTYRDGSGYFWKKWEVYNPNNKEVAKTTEQIVKNNPMAKIEEPAQSQEPPPVDYSEDMPF